jgi:hypothetical protein
MVVMAMLAETFGDQAHPSDLIRNEYWHIDTNDTFAAEQ